MAAHRERTGATGGMPSRRVTPDHGRIGPAWDRPGRRVRFRNVEMILLGRTGDRRYVFATSSCEALLQPRPMIVYMPRLQGRIALGIDPKPRPVRERRGQMGRRA